MRRHSLRELERDLRWGRVLDPLLALIVGGICGAVGVVIYKWLGG